MRISLIHSPKAGEETHPREVLHDLLRRHGHEVVHHAAPGDDWSALIEDPGDLVVAAGGDGTVAAVLLKLIHRPVPVAVLPMGTANNVARGLGIAGGLEDIVAAWATARRRRIDVGVATGPWGKSWFIEGVGLGLFATAMVLLDERDQGRGTKPASRESKLERDVVALKALAADYPGLELDCRIDGKAVAGRFLMVAAMNIASVGPNMDLAPNADPGDGLLDFALVREERRDDFIDYAVTRLRGGSATPPTDVHRGRDLRLSWSGFDAHIDDRTWRGTDPSADAHPQIDITLEPGALEVLVPAADD